MAKERTYEELQQKISESLDQSRGVLMRGHVNAALEGLRLADKLLNSMRESNVAIDPVLQEKFDAFAQDMVIAQEVANEHYSGVSVAEEIHDVGGAAAPVQQVAAPEPQAAAPEPQDHYGACRQNATDGYVALAGGDEDAKGGPCDNCVIL